MTAFLKALSYSVLAVSLSAGLALGDDKKNEDKAPKADVVIGKDAKSGKAKAGDTVEVQLQFPVAPPFPDGFEVTIDGKKVESKTYSGVVTTKDGKPVIGVSLKLVQFKAAGDGKQKVVVSYQKGKDKETKEVELEVTK